MGGEWGRKIGDVRISYQGEIVEKGQRLTLDQVLPGPPPEGYGASLPLVELCEGEVREKLLNLLGNILPDEEMPQEIPRPQIHATRQEWEKIAAERYKRGLVKTVEAPVLVRDRFLVNGSFGVVKPGKFLDDERPILRLIMDFRGTNAATRVLEGDVRSLTGAPALQHVVLPAGKVIRMSADDLVSAFYLFALPPGWPEMMTFAEKVQWRSLGFDREGETYFGAAVLPMGWASAVGVLQHARRRLALRSPLQGGGGLLGQCEIRRDSVFPNLEEEDKLWSLYLDDTSLYEIMEARVAEDLEGKSSEEQEALRRAYAHWGIPFSREKSLQRARRAEKLGAVVDGDSGALKGSTKRALDSLSFIFWLLRQEKAP